MATAPEDVRLHSSGAAVARAVAEPVLLALGARAAAGHVAARDELVDRLMPLVSRLARRFAGRAAQEDLEQAGVVGVLAALPGYDSGRGTAFATYATPFAVGEMLAVARGSAPVHVSRTGRDLAAIVEAAADVVAAEQGRAPSPGEIAAAAGLDEEQVVTGLAARRALAAPASEGVIEDAAGTEDAIEALEARLATGRLLRELDRRSQAILVLRFGLELSQAEIGERLGMSQMHVSRLLRAALDHLDRRID